MKNGRGTRTRTEDHRLPKPVRYQAALHPEDARKGRPGRGAYARAIGEGLRAANHRSHPRSRGPLLEALQLPGHGEGKKMVEAMGIEPTT